MTYVEGHREKLGTGRTQESTEELETIVLTWMWTDKDVLINLDRPMYIMIRLGDQMGCISSFHISTEQQYGAVGGVQYCDNAST